MKTFDQFLTEHVMLTKYNIKKFQQLIWVSGRSYRDKDAEVVRICQSFVDSGLGTPLTPETIQAFTILVKKLETDIGPGAANSLPYVRAVRNLIGMGKWKKPKWATDAPF